MNILPKKKWHVRTKDNMARVRRDEAKAAEEEKAIKERAALADREHRIRVLKQRAEARQQDTFGQSIGGATQAAEETGVDDQPSASSSSTSAIQPECAKGHVNFFAELEAEEHKNMGHVNKEHEAEKKALQDEWAKKVGILSCIDEGSKDVPWYQKPRSIPDEKLSIAATRGVEQTAALNRGKVLLPSFPAVLPSKSDIGGGDVLTPSDLKKKVKRERKAHKKHKRKKSKKSGHKRRQSRSRSRTTSSDGSDQHRGSSSTSSTTTTTVAGSDALKVLREQRLKREREERAKAEQLLRKLRGEPSAPVASSDQQHTKRQPKYNSQFNPDFAKQNR